MGIKKLRRVCHYQTRMALCGTTSGMGWGWVGVVVGGVGIGWGGDEDG